MNNRARILLPVMMVGLIAVGCSILPESRPVQLVDPRVEASGGGRSEAVEWTLGIPRPETDPARDSDRILVRTGTGQLQVHPSARWVAPTPELLRTLLIRYLRDRGTVARVGAGSAGADRTLLLDLRRFELAETADGLAAVIEVDARLYETRQASLRSRRLFALDAAVADADPRSIVAGFEDALAAWTDAVAAWLAAHGNRSDTSDPSGHTMR